MMNKQTRMGRNHRLGSWSIALAVALVAAGCGDDDDDDAVAAYCDGVRRAEVKGEEVFANVDESDPAAGAAAEAELVAFVEADGFMDPDRLPEDIRNDATAFFEGMKVRATGGSATAEQEAAEERLLAWEEQHCPAD